MTDKKYRWLIAIGYVFFIYATLKYVPTPLRFLRSHNFLRITVYSIYGICFLSLLFVLIKDRDQLFLRMFSYLALTSLAVLIGKRIRIPEEQIHFFEYGLVGILFLRALQLHFGKSWKTVLLAFLLGSAAGAADENIQRFIPNRCYDWTDIELNILSVVLGLAVYLTVIPFHELRIGFRSASETSKEE